MQGVDVSELHCPTCGERITDLSLHWDQDVFDVDAAMFKPIAIKPSFERYLLCPRGHKWTIKTIWRARYRPDRVLLGEFLGTE
jgi:hypothetical protein